MPEDGPTALGFQMKDNPRHIKASGLYEAIGLPQFISNNETNVEGLRRMAKVKQTSNEND